MKPKEKTDNTKMLRKEKRKVLLLHILYLLALPIIIIFVMVFDFNNLKISRYVSNNYKQLEMYIKGEIELSDIKNSDFITEVSEDLCNDKTCFVKFSISNTGLISGCYSGFYYSQKDVIHHYEFYKWNVDGNSLKRFTIRDSEKNSDNHIVLKKIRDHWYSYSLCY